MIVFVAAASVCTGSPAARASRSRLRLEPASAVPGQVIAVSARGLSKKSKVKIGGQQAEVVSKKRGELEVRVPDLKPGSARVVVRSAGERLTGRLKVKKGFSGEVKPVLEPLAAASEEVGPEGGTVSATGSDGTRYDLTVPAGALVAPATITLVPVASLAGLPGGEDAHAVQFAPEGLSFAVPAMLRITPSTPLSDTVGLAYTGSGENLTLAPAVRSGGSLLVEVSHFSGTGGTSITEQEFETLVASIAAQPISLVEAGHFFRDYRAVPASWCDENHPTCFELKIDITKFLLRLTPDDCLEGVGNFIDLMRNSINSLFSMEGDAQEKGIPLPAVTQCRSALVTAMFDLTREPARDDPLGFSNPCSGVSLSNADYDGDGQISKIECLLMVAAEAEVQLFSGILNAALIVIEQGLKKVLDEGVEKCDSFGANYLDGLALLKKGQKIASASVLVDEFTAAVLECKEKIRVQPEEITLGPGEHLTFTAKVNYLDPDIRWKATEGTITESGNTATYTAPSKLGPDKVTATDFLIPGVKGEAAVSVVPETVVSIDPTSVNLRPGGTQQFTATVTGPSDTSVTWSATGGTITQSGLYTVGSNTGSFTVTARSVANPTKSASATVTVASLTLGSPSTLQTCAQSDCHFGAGAYNVSESTACGSAGGIGTIQAGLQNGDLHLSNSGSASTSGTDSGCSVLFQSRVETQMQVAGGDVELACQTNFGGNFGIIGQFVSVNGGTLGQRLLCGGQSSNSLTLPPGSYHVTIWYEIQSPRDNTPGTPGRSESFSAEVVTRAPPP